MKKVVLFLLFPLVISCSGEGGGTTTPNPFNFFSSPSPTPSSEIKPSSSATLTQNFVPEKKSDDPITKEQFPDPKIQVQSYQKILKAVDLGDFEYVFKEYDAGGLKNSAIRVETEFNDYPLNYTINSIAQNIGQIGLKNTNMYDFTIGERKIIIKNALRNLLLQSIRGQSRRLVENNKNDLTDDDKYGNDVAKNASIFFYGSEDNNLANGSVASFVKSVDTNNKISTYDNITTSLNKLKSEAKKGDINNLISARDKIEMNLEKVLYIATLDKVATAMDKKDNKELTEAEFFYLSIKNFVKSSNNENTFQVEKIFLNKDYTSIKYLPFEKALASGIKERAFEEMNKAINKISSNTQDSYNSANMSQMYIDIINSSYDNPRFTKTGDPEITKTSQDFLDAIKAKNTQKAKDSMNKISNLFLK